MNSKPHHAPLNPLHLPKKNFNLVLNCVPLIVWPTGKFEQIKKKQRFVSRGCVRDNDDDDEKDFIVKEADRKQKRGRVHWRVAHCLIDKHVLKGRNKSKSNSTHSCYPI